MKQQEGKIIVDGNFFSPSSSERLPVLDPSDGLEFGSIARGNKENIELALESSSQALNGKWGEMIPVERGRLLHTLGCLILENEDELEKLESRDVGKPVRPPLGY